MVSVILNFCYESKQANYWTLIDLSSISWQCQALQEMLYCVSLCMPVFLYYKLFCCDVATRQPIGSLRGTLGKERVQFIVYYFSTSLGNADFVFSSCRERHVSWKVLAHTFSNIQFIVMRYCLCVPSSLVISQRL